MTVKIEEDRLKEGLLGLVIALVEIIADVLKLQAIKRITSGHLSEANVEKLGQAIMDIEETIERIKEEQGLASTVNDIRDNLDDVVDEFIDKIILPNQIDDQ